MRRAPAGPGGSRGAAQHCQRCRHSSGKIPLPLSSAGEPRAQQRGLPQRRLAPSAPTPRGPPSTLLPGGRKNRGGFAWKASLQTGLWGGRRGFLPLFARSSGSMKELCPGAAQPWPGRAPGRAVRRLFPAEPPWPHSLAASNKRIGLLVPWLVFIIFSFSFQKTTATPFARIFFPPPSRRSPRPLCAPPAPPAPPCL